MKIRIKILSGCALFLCVACGRADLPGESNSNTGATNDFGGAFVTPTFTSIRTNIFQNKCLSCHSASTLSGGINLESYSGLTQTTSAHGHAIIVPGDVEMSHLFEVVKSGEMPPVGPKLSSDEVAAIEQWIRNGAKND